MRSQMQNMLTIVRMCRDDLKEQLHAKKQHFEQTMMKEFTSVQDIQK